MTDPATGWFDMTSIETKPVDITANTLERSWLTKYPIPTEVVLDRGTEFMAKVISLLHNDYNITCRTTTTRNLQANTILEQAHHTIRNIISSLQLDKSRIDMDDPCKGILSAVIFAMQSTIHTMRCATPMQLVFGQDAILNLLHEANWQLIKPCNQELINNNNKKQTKSVSTTCIPWANWF